ncbi:MAG TPA: hypothetical protein VM575_11250 [Nocardioides sp.]|nr:hypothetical protein [Nocardioides sp.]
MFTTTRPSTQYRDSQEWGPAKHDPDHPYHLGALETPAYGTDLRDGDDAFPEDN